MKAAKEQPVFKQHYFRDCHRTYSCVHCRAHLANHDELISKLFQGNHGRAYLFNKVVNIGCKQAVQRELLTGLHAVADIYCDNCETTLGWKYEQAFVASQKYKEGKYIIELVHMLKENDWDLTSYNTRQLLAENSSTAPSVTKQINGFRGTESRKVDKFLDELNEFNNFNLEDKSNGALRMVSLEYDLERSAPNTIEVPRNNHQELSVDIVGQPKHNPPPSVTFNIGLVSGNISEDPSQIEGKQHEEASGRREFENVINCSTNGLEQQQYHLGEVQDLALSHGDS